jgi:ATP-dependent helicase HrpB
VIALPIDPVIDRIVGEVRRARAAVIAAAPGAGKTTRVPPALMADGPVILLQPRRVAARAIAARIAAEQGWMLGREVGWQVRFDRMLTADTRLLVVTEGILTARLQNDPLLSDFRTIIVDEFHERSVHADLALALARQAWRARDDLRIVVMSATLDTQPVAAFLDGCPVIEVAGRLYPVTISYAPGATVAASAAAVLRETSGDLLCFLPGALEIRRAIAELESLRSSGGDLTDVDILPLHGSLEAPAQDRALVPESRRRVIVATNIAETSLTVPRVTAVVDSGLHKVARYDADRGIDSLETERIPTDAADQRAGRAGRIGPGIVRRLWAASDRLRPHREPDIQRIDLAATVLDVVAAGNDPRTFEWFEPPPEYALEAAVALLTRLELVTNGERIQLTPLGDRVRRLPLHPRLGRMLVAAAGARDVARACALLSERHLLPPRAESTPCDLLAAIDGWGAVPAHVQRAAASIAEFGLRTADWKEPGRSAIPPVRTPRTALTAEALLRRSLLAGYPDRVAQRREARSPNVLLASGAGAVVAPESGVVDGEFLIAIDLSMAARPGASARPADAPPARTGPTVPTAPNDARIRIASIVDRAWLKPTSTEVVHRLDKESGTVRARRIERYDAIVLAEHHAPLDPEVTALLIADAWLARGPRPEDEQVLRRLRFAGHEIDLPEAIVRASHGARRVADVHVLRALSVAMLKALARDAPETVKVPSGSRVRLHYEQDGTVSASVKLQEVFGLAETPAIGRSHAPLVLHLLSPSGRPVQVTRDLRSFWTNTYPEVRKELRGRYPKHPWPEDPWKATPSARVKRR